MGRVILVRGHRDGGGRRGAGGRAMIHRRRQPLPTLAHAAVVSFVFRAIMAELSSIIVRLIVYYRPNAPTVQE